MITIAVTSEPSDEPRTGLSPETAKKLVQKGVRVLVESGAGLRSRFLDADYTSAGASIAGSAAEALGQADVLLKVRRPSPVEVGALKKGAVVAAMLEPFGDWAGLEGMANAGVTSFAMELMPRISRAQSMDVLSSQSNLAGYKAVVDAAALFQRALPMMMTAAGRTSVAVTMAPSRRAVAMACSPATPTPITNNFAAGTVPAAVIIIGSARWKSAAASTTAL